MRKVLRGEMIEPFGEDRPAEDKEPVASAS
jgi:hypothetical protein